MNNVAIEHYGVRISYGKLLRRIKMVKDVLGRMSKHVMRPKIGRTSEGEQVK